MKPIRIEIIGTTARLMELRNDWQRLFADFGESPFLSWEWQSTWFNWFGDGRAPYVLQVFEGDRLVGLLPMYVEDRRFFGTRVRRAALIGERVGGADYLDVIADPSLRPRIVSVIFEFLSGQKDIDRVSLEGLGSGSGFALCADGSAEFRSSPSSVCPGIVLGSGWDAVLKQSKRADNFKRRLKKLEKTDGFKFRSVTAASSIGDAFERFFELHEARWLAAGGSELSGHPRLAGFHCDAVKEMAGAGLVRFDELWAEGKCRASVYGMESGKTFYYFNAGYDLDWAAKSVGLVLIGLSIRHAIERGIGYYDFLRGAESYKYDWSNTETGLVNVEFNRPGIQNLALGLAAAASKTVKMVSNRILPAGIAEAMKAQKRRLQRHKLGNISAEGARIR